MTKKLKEELINSIKWESLIPKTGGQTVSIIASKEKLISEDLDITIEVGHYRNKLKNRALALILFELAIDKITE